MFRCLALLFCLESLAHQQATDVFPDGLPDEEDTQLMEVRLLQTLHKVSKKTRNNDNHGGIVMAGRTDANFDTTFLLEHSKGHTDALVKSRLATTIDEKVVTSADAGASSLFEIAKHHVVQEDTHQSDAFCGPHHFNHEGDDLMESGVMVSEVGSSLDRCTQMCSDRPACTAFNWISQAPWSGQDECYLKTISDVSQLHGYSADWSNMYFRCGSPAPPPPASGSFCGPHHRNHEGSDLLEGGQVVSESGASLDRCTEMCRERPACTAFNWISNAPWSHQSECFLKTGITDVSQLSGYEASWANIYLRCDLPPSPPPPSPPPPLPLPDAFCGPHHRNHVGNDLMESGSAVAEMGASLDRCTQICRERPMCSAFNWISVAPWSLRPECYLKTGLSDPSQLNSYEANWANMYFRCSDPVSPPSPPPGQDGFDVIIVGSGLTGAAFAGKLVEELDSNKRILLLEAGHASHSQMNRRDVDHGADGSDPPASCTSSGCTPWHSWDPSGGTRWDVPGNYPELPCWDTQCAHAWHNFPSYQCKVLGGCGVSNGALMQHPSPNNFLSWPAGWQSSQLEPYFIDVQNRFSITGTPSRDGQHYLDEFGANKLREALHGVGFMDDDRIERPRARTMGIPKVAAHDGVRWSTANTMLADALDSSNFHMSLGCEVREILFEQGRAIGVRYTHQGVSQTVTLNSGGRVVLAAGAFNSPRILLNSGVGPGKSINNPGVGRGISDHSITSIKYRFPSNSGIQSFSYNPPSQEAIDQYINHRSGPLTQFGPTIAAFIKSGDENDGDFDVEVFVNAAKNENEMDAYFILMKPDCSSADLTLGSGGDTVDMHGSVHLNCPNDVARLQSAIDIVTNALNQVGGTREDQNWHADNMNHWAGSCKLGSCVDATTLLVHGTENVAVVDASILPGQIWGHPALTLKAIALKAADIVGGQLQS